jgi:molybdenum cofactor guanylyltransferase
MSEFTLVVNAGGDSRRMHGSQKALLPVPPHGHPLIDHIVGLLAPLATSELVIVANSVEVRRAVTVQGDLCTTLVADRWPGSGAMGGIATGLMYCREWAIVAACDMPFVNPGLFGILCQLAGETDYGGRRRWDAVVPRVDGYPQMLHTLYHRAMLPTFRRCMDRGDLKLLSVLPAARVRYMEEDEMTPVDPDLRSFVNVNTRADWEQALRMQRESIQLSN